MDLNVDIDHSTLGQWMLFDLGAMFIGSSMFLCSSQCRLWLVIGCCT